MREKLLAADTFLSKMYRKTRKTLLHRYTHRKNKTRSKKAAPPGTAFHFSNCNINLPFAFSVESFICGFCQSA